MLDVASMPSVPTLRLRTPSWMQVLNEGRSKHVTPIQRCASLPRPPAFGPPVVHVRQQRAAAAVERIEGLRSARGSSAHAALPVQPLA